MNKLLKREDYGEERIQEAIASFIRSMNYILSNKDDFLVIRQEEKEDTIAFEADVLTLAGKCVVVGMYGRFHDLFKGKMDNAPFSLIQVYRTAIDKRTGDSILSQRYHFKVETYEGKKRFYTFVMPE